MLWPLFVTPEWMQTLALITPHGWANSAFNKLMLFGAGGGDVVLEMAALAAFGLGLPGHRSHAVPPLPEHVLTTRSTTTDV